MITSATVKGRCSICGAGPCRCGPETSHITSIDVTQEATHMAGPLEVYDVVYNGQETSMKLTEEQAAAMGAKKRTARNKARTAGTAETKTDDGPHVCDVCGFEAKTAGGLGSHERSHEDA